MRIGDIILLLSDGVYDNLDPEAYGNSNFYHYLDFFSIISTGRSKR